MPAGHVRSSESRLLFLPQPSGNYQRSLSNTEVNARLIQPSPKKGQFYHTSQMFNAERESHGIASRPFSVIA